MELATTPDNYTLTVGADGVYEDRIGPFSAHPQGVICPCNNRHYVTRTSMVNHVKTDNHKKYKDALNANRANHAVELENAQKLIKEQRIIIAKLERDKLELFRTINLLTNMTTSTASVSTVAPDLMTFD